jgi:hypothetical protein
VGAPSPRTLILDTGALIAFDRGNAPIRAALRLGLEHGAEVALPAGVLAQAWRDAGRQANLARLVDDPRVHTEDLTRTRAKATGVLCARSGTADVVDASVVLCARSRRDAVILTSDPDDLRLIDPAVRVERV